MADQLAPRLDPLTQEEIGTWVGRIETISPAERVIVLRGLISDHITLRADCARYLARAGTIMDLPYLIDALSDETMHVGANYSYAGMATTRYWANVALISITNNDYGYRWDDPLEKRQEAIERWKQFWNNTKNRHKDG